MTLGDRVAVMLDGPLQQVAAPQALYERPVNEFVAGFIGSPSINLVEAEPRALGRRVVRELRWTPPRRGRGCPPCAAEPRDYVDRTVLLGFARSTWRMRRSSRIRRPTGASHDVRSDGAARCRGARALHRVCARPGGGHGRRQRPHPRRLSTGLRGRRLAAHRTCGSPQQDQGGRPDRARGRHEPPLLLRPGDARSRLGGPDETVTVPPESRWRPRCGVLGRPRTD